MAQLKNIIAENNLKQMRMEKALHDTILKS